MSFVEIVGAVGHPVGPIGWLVPILRNHEGMCFQVGDKPDTGFPDEELPQYAKDDMIICFAPVPATSAIPALASVTGTVAAERFTLPHYVLFVSRQVEDLLAVPAIGRPSDENGLIPLKPTADLWTEFRFYLSSSAHLRESVLPRLFQEARERLNEYYKERIRRGLGRRTVEDEADLLARTMSAIAYDQSTAEEAIKYEGLLLLDGPYGENFSAWLTVALSGWDIPWRTDPDHWSGLCWGIRRTLDLQIRGEEPRALLVQKSPSTKKDNYREARVNSSEMPTNSNEVPANSMLDTVSALPALPNIAKDYCLVG